MRHNDAFCTLDQVGAALGVTRERARQIETRALMKCRAEIERRGLTFADLVPDARDDPESDWPNMRGS